ncbi:helix-turn-helix domain-containing protein [Riemerella anatipestifer]|uniref:helix-turn-helix transcriptional regulator n=1 Tax=Riemerella anatipestifer TaxID=34085 RepID=UPI0030C50880
MKNIPKVQYQGRDKKVGFEMFPLENLVNIDIPNNHNPFQPHRIDFFAILFLTSGAVEHTLDFKKYHLTPYDCLVISKGQVHSFDSVHKYKGFLILFTEDFLEINISKSTINNISKIYNYHIFGSKYKVEKESIEIFNLLNKEQKEKNHNLKPNIVASLLSAFLLKLENHNQKEPFKATYNHQYDLFVCFEKNLEKYFSENRNAKFYAEKQNITYKHLNEVCKQFSNKSAKEFIDDFIILEAKRQLSSTNLSVKEIAYYCGFDEVTNFQKYFKKITAETPISFRQKFQ